MTQGKKKEQPGGTERLKPTRRKVARGARTRKRRASMCPAAAWEESTVRRGVEGDEEQQYTKSKAHVRRANSGTEETARCGARLEGGRDGKAGGSNTMPCVQKDVPHA